MIEKNTAFWLGSGIGNLWEGATWVRLGERGGKRVCVLKHITHFVLFSESMTSSGTLFIFPFRSNVSNATGACMALKT